MADDLWEGFYDAEAGDEPNPFDQQTHPLEHEAFERSVSSEREEYRAKREARRSERHKRELEAETDRELLRLEARKAAEQIYNDRLHLASDGTHTDAGSSWAPMDLTTVLDGSYIPEEPALMPRTDGVHLLYPGRVHTFQGESESGKSMVAQAEAARVVAAGGTVAYLDFESDASVVVGRILMMGADRNDVAERLQYLRPGVRPGATQADRAAFADLLGQRFDLVVIDGVTEAAAVFGVVSKDNDEVTAWNREFARPLAQRTGAAVIQVDHVTKDADSRGRFAIGAQAKMAALDGASYVVEVKEPLGRGLRGVIAMRIAKDRPGAIRPHCGPFRATDRTQEACRVVVDSTTDGVIAVWTEPPSVATPEPDGSAATFRPTALMERVSEYLARCPAPVSENEITKNVTGKGVAVRKAVAMLVEDGYVSRLQGARGSNLHKLIAIYRQSEDPKSDKYQPPFEGVA